MTLLNQMTDLLWNPWLLLLFLLTGGYFSFRTGFFQLFCIKTWWSSSIGSLFHTRRQHSNRGITEFQALSTALAATIGTGSVAGVATAIFYGGPGAVFWMWVSAFLGMMTSCAEKTLAVRYRQCSSNGGWQGGPMFYISHGLGTKPLALVFSLFCIIETLIGGNLVQSNSISTAVEASLSWDPLLSGLITAALTGTVIFGGIARIGKVSERLVPCMAILFLAGGLIVLFCNLSVLPSVLHDILIQALTPKAACGGYGAAAALRYGVARGVFTNEAGLGTSAMAHAAADVDTPAQQGMWGIFEVFLSTLVICTITALVILTSGVYDPVAAQNAIASGTVENFMLGAPLSAKAFSTVYGHLGSIFISGCLILFAFTSLLGACYYGEQCLAYITGSRQYVPLYRLFFLIMIVFGGIVDLPAAWLLVDLSNGLMAIPNLIALLCLSGEAIDLIKCYRNRP